FPCLKNTKYEVWLVDESYNQKLLALSEESGQLRVNLDHQVKQLILVSDSLQNTTISLSFASNKYTIKQNQDLCNKAKDKNGIF
ncbi:hypothetical protein L9F63_026696, partial [Diploptera punctata]